MFKKQEESQGEIETIIGPTVKVEGDFHGEGSVVVDGEVVGSLKTNKNLKIGPNAKINADIEAANILVAGEVRGNLNIKDKTELKSSAKVTGDIQTKVISIDLGAILNGKCTSGQETAEIKDNYKPKTKNNKNNQKKLEEL